MEIEPIDRGLLKTHRSGPAHKEQIYLMPRRRWRRVTMTTMATGDNDDDGDGAMGDGATGYDDNDDGDGIRRRWHLRDGQRR
jgi:hypothetical protein